MKPFVQMQFDGKIYSVTPEMKIITDIEDEIGAIAVLQQRFMRQEWKVSELVMVVQMLLQAAGLTVDYRLLGNRMVADGLESYRTAVVAFLQRILGEKEFVRT